MTCLLGLRVSLLRRYPRRRAAREAAAPPRREEILTGRGLSRAAPEAWPAWPYPRTSSPRSTTSGSPCPTSTRRSRSTATPSAWRRCTRRPTRSRASARRWSRSATQMIRRFLHPAARPAHPGLDDREVPGPRRPRHAAAGLPGRGRRSRLRRAARARRTPPVRRPPPRYVRLARQLRPPQGRRRCPDRAGGARAPSWSRKARSAPVRIAPPVPPTLRLRFAQRGSQAQLDRAGGATSTNQRICVLGDPQSGPRRRPASNLRPCSRSATPSWPATPRARSTPPSRCPSPTAR